MAKPKKPLTIEDLSNPEVIRYYRDKFEKIDPEIYALEDQNAFWYKTFDFMVKNINIIFKAENVNAEVVYPRLLELFEIDTLVHIYVYYDEYRSIASMDALKSIDMSCDIIDPLMCMSWQWYYEDRNPDIVFNLWKKFNSIAGQSVFNDDRFSVYPVFTNAYQRGYDSSEWIRDLEAGWLSVFEESTQTKGLQRYKTSAFKTNYLDAKIGFVIYFKNMPSMVVSFNCDKDWNLYVHQVQCKPKDRGHYKLNNWAEQCLDLVKDLFSEYHVHLMDSEGVVDNVMKGYTSSDNSLKPSSSALARIKTSYDKIFADKQELVSKSDFSYRLM